MTGVAVVQGSSRYVGDASIALFSSLARDRRNLTLCLCDRILLVSVLILISGIGRSFARHLLQKSALQVVATSRDASAARESILDGLDKKDADRLTTLSVDGLKEDTIKSAASQVESDFGKDSLRFLINCSGVLHIEKSLSAIDAEKMLNSFQLNTFAHLLTFKHFARLVPSGKTSPSSGEDDPAQGLVPKDHSVLASLTARVGSTGDNERGGWYSYRASKAAANSIIKTLSIELKQKSANNTIAIAAHPGSVAGTDLSHRLVPKEKAGSAPGVHSPEDAVRLLFEQFGKLKPEQSGTFIDYAGKSIEW